VDPGEPRRGRQTVEALPDRVGMRWSAVREAEHIVAGESAPKKSRSPSRIPRHFSNADAAVPSTEIVWSAFSVLPPAFVSCVTCYYDAVVKHGDLTPAQGVVSTLVT
jgi:hypothetical protein